jgi:hypothetical protein
VVITWPVIREAIDGTVPHVPFDPLQRRTTAGLAFRPHFTQGALLDGLRLPRYGNGRYAGFLITARCDLAHVRTDTINLLPVVPIREWLHLDGCIGILLARLLSASDKLQRLAELLPAELRDLIGSDWKEGYDLFVAGSPIDAPLKDRLRQAIAEHSELDAILRTGSDTPEAITKSLRSSAAFRSLVERESRKKVGALIENKIADAHFLPVIRPDEALPNGPGYVILFRQIVSIPGRLMESLEAGAYTISDLSPELQPPAGLLLSFPAGLVSNVCSPHVEHILQRFSSVFSRVGVTDCSERYRNWLIDDIHRDRET